eukprot:Gb_21077 [translate_table: standard]
MTDANMSCACMCDDKVLEWNEVHGSKWTTIGLSFCFSSNERWNELSNVLRQPIMPPYSSQPESQRFMTTQQVSTTQGQMSGSSAMEVDKQITEFQFLPVGEKRQLLD